MYYSYKYISSSNIYKIQKRISTYTRYIYNLGRNNFDLLANHTPSEMIIIVAIIADLFWHQKQSYIAT